MNGKITPDSDFAREIGFTSDLFDGWLWKRENEIYISFIVSKQPRKGNFKRLLESILNKGYTVKIPTPIGVMNYIVRKYGFEKTYEFWEEVGEGVEVWVKSPQRKEGGLWKGEGVWMLLPL